MTRETIPGVVTNPSPSSAGDEHTGEMSQPKEVGSTWIWHYEKKKWPVVLCRDEIAPKNFLESRNNPLMVPAILLGRHKFIWVILADLEEFDPSQDYFSSLPSPASSLTSGRLSEAENREIQRQTAFARDALLFQDDQYWANCIFNRSEAKKNDARRQAQDRRERRQRKEKRRMLSPSSSPFNRSSGNTHQSTEIPGRNVDSNNEKESKIIAYDGRYSSNAIDIDREDGERRSGSPDDGDEAPSKTEVQRQKNLLKVQSNRPPTHMCTIFVGPEYTPFTSSRVALGKCDFLCNLEIFTEELHSHVVLHPETDITSSLFRPIGDYLKKGDFWPVFAKSITTDRFEDFFTPDDEDQVAENIAWAYYTAAKIKFEDVQKLCLRKLLLLDSLSPTGLLIVAKIAKRAAISGFEVEKSMQYWLANETSRKFWHLVEFASSTLRRTMEEDSGLRREVFKRLGKNPDNGFEGLDEV